ncbi:Kinesin-like protein Klp98A [Eumeta japonica]|uniref:Kinesin-like protein Klp98A n=1 Tax=Eumeta variegata TaxID=151549 RepID=A0A4C1V0V9_EUMVA|nr:Kinesin-like protein Klp98A [Eumeta japonica]
MGYEKDNNKDQNDIGREKYKDFTFDHSYWSFDNEDKHYASQEQVFADLGLDVIDSAFEGYNACVFAYGQTGSGKTFTMMGSSENQGLIPRICRQLFSRVAAGKESGSSYRTEVSYLEIYNERVKDLLAGDAGHSLRVREHPKLGPYVQDLSKHLVSDYDDIQECMHRGNLHRTTASTQMNDVSSRSHAIFTVTFVQAGYLRHNNMPCETVSKVHLVDLAGSERADATGATGQRLVEGAHINKSLVTLGSVISALAESSQHQPTDKTPKGTKKNVFIPYRDSVLTWLLKDSLGGNSKTIMIAAISPADCNYGETLSTLRYANRAKNIINKPTINEDPNVKLIRELREEIEKLRAQISHNTNPIETEPAVLATLQRKEAQEKVLTEKWTEKWRETQQILQEQKALGLRKSGLGVVLDSDMPHLVGIDDNLLSTGVTLYHLKEGETLIGSEECETQPDIILTGAGVLPEHCRITLQDGVATIHPNPNAQCWLNTVLIDKPAKLSQGCILLLGRTNMFRYNDPAEAAKLRQEGSASVMNLSRLSLLSWSTTDLAASTENLNTTLSDLESEIRCERIEAQRAELERERQQFLLQQEERQRRWHQEKEELLQAQKKLDEERQAMEREYAAACRRLSGDWRALERGWCTRRRALRTRQRDLNARAKRLRGLSETHQQCADNEEGHVMSLQTELEGKKQELETFIKCSIRELIAQGCKLDESTTPSPDGSPQSETSTECLMHLLQQCEPKTASSIRDTVERHKKELVELEKELQTRVASVASHRAKVERLQAELALLSTQEIGLRHALLGSEMSQSAELAMDEKTSPMEGVKRSKSELVLRRVSRPEERFEPLSADEHEEFKKKKMNLSLSLDPLTSPDSTLTTFDDTFHTATSNCSPLSKPFPSDSSLLSPTSTTDVSMRLDSSKVTSPIDKGSSPFDAKDQDLTDKTENGSHPPVNFKLGPMPRVDDSDEMSSTEDYNKPRIIEGQSSSSLDRSPDERHQRAKYRRRIAGESKASGRRQVTEAEALRAMQRLCQRIAAQKMLVISSLENDCSKEELNRQIAVLQELQKKYVRLEMALQYSFFDNHTNSRSRNIMVTPIQETPSLTLSESDMQVTQEQVPSQNVDNNVENNVNNSAVMLDPLMQRLKDNEVEASDNVSTSNDELPSENNDNTWSDYVNDPLRSHRNDNSDRSSGSSLKSSAEARSSHLYGDGHFTDVHLPELTASAGLTNPIDFGLIVFDLCLCLRMSESYGRSRACCFDDTAHSVDVFVFYSGGWATIMKFVTAIDTATIEFCKPVINSPLAWCFITKSSSKLNRVISVPGWVTRGAGASTHHEYEVRVELGVGTRWALLRRYRRFRELYLNMKNIYGPKVASIPFPSRQLWSSEAVARARRPQLEAFLRRLLTVCSTDKRCPFHAQPLTRETLVQFSPFFRKVC